jgi:predicted membrane protein
MNREERQQRRDELRKCSDQTSSGRIWSGLLLLAVGGLLLARQIGANIPDWMFHWPMLLIAIGLLISLKSGFRNAGGSIMILVGVAFLLNDIIPNAHMQDFIWPGILIIAGIIFIMKPKSHSKKHLEKWEDKQKDWSNYKEQFSTSQAITETIPVTGTSAEEPGEYIEVNAVFGSVNKLILSKNFKGGEVNCFMGGSELNLLQADIKHKVQLEINNVFGGTKLIVPGNWYIKNEITAVFGGVEDKRNANVTAIDPDKILILKGACVFGGLEVRNF